MVWIRDVQTTTGAEKLMFAKSAANARFYCGLVVDIEHYDSVQQSIWALLMAPSIKYRALDRGKSILSASIVWVCLQLAQNHEWWSVLKNALKNISIGSARGKSASEQNGILYGKNCSLPTSEIPNIYAEFSEKRCKNYWKNDEHYSGVALQRTPFTTYPPL